MQAPTKHFGWHELGHPPPKYRANATHLAHHLEHLRILKRNRPLMVLSAYRDPSNNRRVGGADGSLHLVGLAADIPKGYATTRDAEAAGFVGIGSNDGWAVHVDLRDGPSARWTY